MMEKEDEKEIGFLCREGLMKEEYSEEYQDLVRSLTDKGIDYFKDMVKDQKYKKMFIQVFCRETKGMHIKDQAGVLKIIKEMLNKNESRKKSQGNRDSY